MKQSKDLTISSKNSVVCVFAHPDDEAFGPAGTIAKFAQDHDVYIICATRGEVGGNPQIREKEMRQSAKILGVKKVYFLDFIDGTLSNSLYHKLAEKIESLLKKLKPQTLITFEPRGISGHIDHITVSLVTTYVFERQPSAKTLLYFCISNQNRQALKDYFIYFPPGYKKSEIDLVIDISDFWDKKVAAMKVHQSQWQDAAKILKHLKQSPREEYFLVLEK